MSKASILLAPVVAFCLVGCAHDKPYEGASSERASAIRMDATIRTACGDKDVDPFFSYDSVELSPKAAKRLDMIAECMTNGYLKDKRLAITGYTDASGNAKYNKFLGKERADSVVDYLVSKGIDRKRFDVASKGEAGASDNPNDWAWDRMVDLALAP